LTFKSNRPAARAPLDLGSMPRWAATALFTVAALALGAHFLHTFSEAINWDEFALLARADMTYRFGQVAGGGRGGLVSILLTPFAMNCVDSVVTVVHARLLWQIITLTYLVAVYFLVRRWFTYAGRPNEGQAQGILAVALLAFLPAFVTWSVQVRTDQTALAAATLGGVALLSSSHRQATVAGALFGIAMLCSQKAAYVTALVGLMYATASVARIWVGGKKADIREFRQVVTRFATVCLVGAIVFTVYLTIVPSTARLITGHVVASAIDSMDWVRQQQGYRAYTVHSGRLIVHWVLFATLIAWTIRAMIRREKAEYLLLATCWSALTLGLVVARFHGSSFPYFIMTAGLFPAVSFGMIAGGPLALCGRMRWLVLVTLVVLATFQSARETLEMLDDTQQGQRETMVIANGLVEQGLRGYSVESALFCARDPDPIPTMFSQQIWRRFKDSPGAASDFVADFRNRPIAFFVESYRMNQFPPQVRQFFADHYVWYAASVFVAGYELLPNVAERRIDVIVPGQYQWVPSDHFPESKARIGDQLLRPYSTVRLDTGVHLLSSASSPSAGILLFGELPSTGRDSYPAFYSERQGMQLGGWR
jgi:hypothetical protein